MPLFENAVKTNMVNIWNIPYSKYIEMIRPKMVEEYHSFISFT